MKPARPAPTASRPVLESGDRLTRAEFHRRYCQRPDIKKAELIDGVVYVGSPLSLDRHGEPHIVVSTWVGTYWTRHSELRVGDNATVYLDDRTEVQPDIVLFREATGGPRRTANGYVEGAPQLIVEIAASSASYDLHDKLQAYQRNGVREYIVWRTVDGMVDWFRLQDGAYVWVEPDMDGLIESSEFPGLRLDVPKLLAGDLAGVLAALDLA